MSVVEEQRRLEGCRRKTPWFSSIPLGGSWPTTAEHPDALEVLNTAAADANTFRRQQRPLERLVAAIAAKTTAGSNHSMARHVGPCAAAHDVADGPCRPGRPDRAATSPYVATRPTGICRTTESTRTAKAVFGSMDRLVMAIWTSRLSVNSVCACGRPAGHWLAVPRSATESACSIRYTADFPCVRSTSS